ncbi:hypothetical protein LZ496_10830 [Sphingomonas sp. NSE70-1]|uniref:LPXTG-motif cell wall anchor domain-containing protein n=1 Tax=Sphingomonas caseinilyticus TaxID=2908205 RepID=A0ABT0RW82_9SPHN|nr:hypothetical protein [Sphingomonas caseinilyticus]MCL6699272.1 hypothetical protein [Sphingomonas caseinilyticus]
MAAALALALAAPVGAQSTDAPIDVTAAPPPSAETIGPSQLRDFNLQGTVTRPADRPAATAAQPVDTATAQPRRGEAVPAEAAAPSPAPGRNLAQRAAPVTVSGRTALPAGVAANGRPLTPSLPLEVTTDPAPQPDAIDPGLAPTASNTGGGLISWPWLAALVALIGGGAFLFWSRRDRDRRHGDPGRMAFAGLAPDIAEPDLPRAQPRPDPVPSRGGASAGPRADPVPPAGTARPSPAPKPAGDGTIVASKLKPQLNVEFVPDRVVITEKEVMLMFEIVIANVGSAPAREVLVEGHLFTAHVGQDREIATFFQNPTASDDRMTLIAPLGRVSLKSVARLPLDEIHQFEAGGRKLFVPLIGFNILYRFGGTEGQASASFLVGRGNVEDEKLAPFRIDQGPKIFRGLSSRPHSIGMQNA